jgi:hypothetical protein
VNTTLQYSSNTACSMVSYGSSSPVVRRTRAVYWCTTRSRAANAQLQKQKKTPSVTRDFKRDLSCALGAPLSSSPLADVCTAQALRSVRECVCAAVCGVAARARVCVVWVCRSGFRTLTHRLWGCVGAVVGSPRLSVCTHNSGCLMRGEPAILVSDLASN